MEFAMTGKRYAFNIVHLAEAESPQTSPDRLQQLASNRSQKVRMAVAKNPNTPSAALEQLASEPADEPQTGSVLFGGRFITTSGRRFVTANTPTSTNILKAVAMHPNTPPDVLGVLVLDVNPEIQQAALKTLQNL
jgi:hypothetical protein